MYVCVGRVVEIWCVGGGGFQIVVKWCLCGVDMVLLWW